MQKNDFLYLIGRDKKTGNAITASAQEIIGNALEQERSGVKPHYVFYDYKNNCATHPAGWLVWSSLDYGCGIVYRRKDGKMIISTGRQGDFACI